MNAWRRFLRFNGVGAMGIVVQLATVVVLAEWVGANAGVATFAGVMTAIVHNFVWHQRWTWADRSGEARRTAATFVRFAFANGAVSLAGNLVVVLILTRAAGWRAVTANAVAIAVSGLINYWLGDRVVFVGSRAARPHTMKT